MIIIASPHAITRATALAWAFSALTEGLIRLLGLPAGDPLVGIDFRIARGVLYGLSRQGMLFTIDTASGRLTRSQWIARWGVDVAKKLDREIRTGFENFRQLSTEIDCDAYDGGHLYLAHRPEKLAYLRSRERGWTYFCYASGVIKDKRETDPQSIGQQLPSGSAYPCRPASRRGFVEQRNGQGAVEAQSAPPEMRAAAQQPDVIDDDRGRCHVQRASGTCRRREQHDIVRCRPEQLVERSAQARAADRLQLGRLVGQEPFRHAQQDGQRRALGEARDHRAEQVDLVAIEAGFQSVQCRCLDVDEVFGTTDRGIQRTGGLRSAVAGLQDHPIECRGQGDPIGIAGQHRLQIDRWRKWL